jgi:hypothetical protein
MSFLPVAQSLLAGLPQLVLDIERNHTEKSGESKKQLALDAIATGLSAVEASTPRHAQQIAEAAEHFGSVIDSIVHVFNLFGVFGHKGQSQTATTGQ